MHNFLQAVEWSNQEFVGPGLQVYGLATPLAATCLFLFLFRPDLMVKKLRYYARFIVVSLLLNKVDLVKELIQELHHYVEEYVSVYEAEDDEEWRLVISEVTAFMEVSYTKACGPFLERCGYLASNRSRFSNIKWLAVRYFQ